MIKAKNGNVIVRLVRPHGAFPSGALAGYSEAQAADLIGKGIAVYAAIADVPESKRGKVVEVIAPSAPKGLSPAEAEADADANAETDAEAGAETDQDLDSGDDASDQGTNAVAAASPDAEAGESANAEEAPSADSGAPTRVSRRSRQH